MGRDESPRGFANVPAGLWFRTAEQFPEIGVFDWLSVCTRRSRAHVHDRTVDSPFALSAPVRPRVNRLADGGRRLCPAGSVRAFFRSREIAGGRCAAVFFFFF